MENEAMEKLKMLRAETTSGLDHSNVYNKLDRLGINIGESSQRLRNIWRGSRVDAKSSTLRHFGYGDIEFSEDERSRLPVQYNVPPLVLDAAFGTTIAPQFEAGSFLAIPRRIGELTFLPPQREQVCQSRYFTSLQDFMECSYLLYTATYANDWKLECFL